MAIKAGLKKLDLGGPYAGFFPQHMLRNNFEWLNRTDADFSAVAAMPSHHRDPFDRPLVAQATAGGMPIVSADTAFDAYPVERLW